MKTRLLFSLLAILFLLTENARAVAVTWTGGSSINWSDHLNWSTGAIPTSTDLVTIVGGTTFAPTVDIPFIIKGLATNSTVTITLSALLTVNNAFIVSGGTTTIAGTGSATVGAPSSIDISSALVIGSGATLTFTKALNVARFSTLTNNGTLKIKQSVSAADNPSSIINTGLIAFSSATLDVEAGCSADNTGTITTDAASNVKLNGSPALLNNNLNGVFNATSTTFAMADGSSITNTGGAFTMTSCTVNCSGTPTSITNINSGATVANFTMSGTTVNFTGTNGITNTSGVFTINSGSLLTMKNASVSSFIANSGTFTVNGGSTLTLTSTSANSLTNSGTFYAGTSASACTLNLNSKFATVTNSAASSFYLGSTSVINVAANGATVTNSGTFTIQSDINGSGTIGPVTGATPFSGTYNVERYLSGGSSAYRSYRSLSSPVYAAPETVSGNTFNAGSINYIAATSPTTGSGGTLGGFTQGGNPTFYLFRDNIAPSNATFTSGNFRGVGDISSSPSYTIDADGSGFYIPAGNGFLFFDRGDMTNLGTKFTPGTSAESVTLTATGTLNTGAVKVTPWFKPTTAALDYTAVAGNGTVLGFALVGNPYASSIDWETYSTVTPAAGVYAPNVGPTIYILNPLNLNYETYIKGGAGGVVGLGTYSDAANIIPGGQGFFVVASNASASLTFNEAAKTNTQVSVGNQNLFLGAPPQAVAGQYLRVKIIKDSIQNDAILITFNNSAKPQYIAGEDAAHRPGGGQVDISSMSADRVPLAINSQPLPKTAPVIIPLIIYAAADGVYQLTMPAVKNLAALYDVWLMDAYRNDSLDFKHNPVYSFDVYKSDTASYGANRFKLVVRQNAALMVHMLSFTAAKVYNSAQVVWTTENEQNYTNFTVERSSDGGATFNAVGGYASSGLGTYSLLDKAPPEGIDQYRLKMVDLNGTISYSNVVRLSFNPSNTLTKGNISIYPNPSASMINLSINNANSGLPPGVSLLQNLASTPALATAAQNAGPAYDIKIISGATGAVIKSAASSSPNWQANVSNLTPGTYILQVTNSADKTLVGKSMFVKL